MKNERNARREQSRFSGEDLANSNNDKAKPYRGVQGEGSLSGMERQCNGGQGAPTRTTLHEVRWQQLVEFALTLTRVMSVVSRLTLMRTRLCECKVCGSWRRMGAPPDKSRLLLRLDRALEQRL